MLKLRDPRLPDALALSRNEKDLGKKFQEVKDSIAALDVQDAIIDGEIVALDGKGRSSFQALQGFDIGQERPPLVFYAFDLLQLDRKDFRNLPIEERKAKLEKLLKRPPGVIRYSVSFTKDIEELLDRVRRLGLEGLIGKRSGSRYEAGKRTGAWVKIKLHQEQEFVIGGYTEPEGARKHFGALLVGFDESKRLKFAGRVGTGFSRRASDFFLGLAVSLIHVRLLLRNTLQTMTMHMLRPVGTDNLLK